MLSKVSVLILGIIEEKPINPYEINKLLDEIRIKDWFSVAASSVFSTIKTLEKRGYITGKVIKEGNMPEKTIYSSTLEGRNALNKTLSDFLSSKKLDPIEFNIGTIMMCHLEKNTVLELLEVRLDGIEQELNEIKKQYNYFIEVAGIPAYALISLRHNEHLFEAEIKTTLELIGEIKRNQGWNNFLNKAEG